MTCKYLSGFKICVYFSVSNGWGVARSQICSPDDVCSWIDHSLRSVSYFRVLYSFSIRKLRYADLIDTLNKRTERLYAYQMV